MDLNEKNGQLEENKNSSFLLEYPKNYNEIAEMALRRLEKDYENTIKSNQINEEAIKQNQETSKEKEDDSESELSDAENNQNYTPLIDGETNDNEFSEFEEYNSQAQVNEGKLELEINENQMANKPSEISTDKKEENTLEKVHFNNEEKEKIKNAMKKINIKAPIWAKNISDEDFINYVKGKAKIN